MGGDLLKRSFDVVASAVLVVVALPVMFLATIGTAISLRAWPFFTQTRIGRKGEPFRFVKLRTLPVHAPPYTDKYELAHLDVPAFSRLLRRLHLDELPQLFLVLTGKMSLVGPRPEMPYLHRQFDPLFAALRSELRPGCTGLWQISDKCDRMIAEHPEFDEFYVRHHSIRLDLWIVARTIKHCLPFGSSRLTPYERLPVWATRNGHPVAMAVTAATPEPVLQASEV
jgi:lipopolysaccharide/colanic/teichoic acid biosynthesis glycosyltransferase